MEKKRRKMEGGKVKKWGEDFFLFLFFYAFHFSKWLKNLFWVYQNGGNFLPGKSISRREKNKEKLLRPLRKISLLHPCFCHIHTQD